MRIIQLGIAAFNFLIFLILLIINQWLIALAVLPSIIIALYDQNEGNEEKLDEISKDIAMLKHAQPKTE